MSVLSIVITHVVVLVPILFGFNVAIGDFFCLSRSILEIFSAERDAKAIIIVAVFSLNPIAFPVDLVEKSLSTLIVLGALCFLS